MKKIILLSVFLSSILFCKAQVDSAKIVSKNPITVNGSLWKGITYSYNGTPNMDIRKVRTMLNIDNQNATLLKQAKNAKLISRIAAVAGGICLGFGLNSYLSQAEFNVPVIVGGAALIGLSLPISSLSIRKMKKAVLRYNVK